VRLILPVHRKFCEYENFPEVQRLERFWTERQRPTYQKEEMEKENNAFDLRFIVHPTGSNSD
jgi:hypothetical protein